MIENKIKFLLYAYMHYAALRINWRRKNYFRKRETDIDYYSLVKTKIIIVILILLLEVF